VVLSFRNEQEVLPELIARLREVMGSLSLDYELVFVNDASTDGSLPLLMEEAAHDPHIRIVNMSRRFGVSECVLAGMRYARGDAVIYMDADLQDPPEVIPDLIRRWREGAEVVHTVRTARRGESELKLALTRAAYRLIGRVSDIPLAVEAGDFKLLSRRVVDELLRLPEHGPYLRGLAAWVGFQQATVTYERQERRAGTSHFPVFRNLLRDLCTLHGPAGTLLRGITSFSILPLMAFLLAGGLLSLAGAAGLVVWVLVWLFAESGPSGVSLIVLALVLLSGLQLLGVGTVGLYLGRVYSEVRGRPRYIVASTYGFDRPARQEAGPKAEPPDDATAS